MRRVLAGRVAGDRVGHALDPVADDEHGGRREIAAGSNVEDAGAGEQQRFGRARRLGAEGLHQRGDGQDGASEHRPAGNAEGGHIGKQYSNQAAFMSERSPLAARPPESLTIPQ